MAVGPDERSRDGAAHGNHGGAGKISFERRVRPSRPNAQSQLTKRSADQDTGQPNQRGSDVSVAETMKRKLGLNHVVGCLAVGRHLRKAEHGKAEVMRDYRLNGGARPEMKGGEWHSFEVLALPGRALAAKGYPAQDRSKILKRRNRPRILPASRIVFMVETGRECGSGDRKMNEEALLLEHA